MVVCDAFKNKFTCLFAHAHTRTLTHTHSHTHTQKHTRVRANKVFPATNPHGEENEPFAVTSDGVLYAAASDAPTYGNTHDSGVRGALLMRRVYGPGKFGPIFWVASAVPPGQTTTFVLPRSAFCVSLPALALENDDGSSLSLRRVIITVPVRVRCARDSPLSVHKRAGFNHHRHHF